MCEKRLTELLGPAFYGLARDVFRHGHTHYELSGGRGSLKSSCVSLLVLLLLAQHPEANALVLRKVAATLRDSVWAQYLWAVEQLGMGALWEARASPLELRYRPTGQRILFRGMDDPMKLKSLKVPSGYIAVTHFEEKDQFSGRQEIRSVLQSTMRGGALFWNFETFNPPRSRDHWANRDSLEPRPDRLCHRSTYLEAPRAWLGEPFFAEAEDLRLRDEKAWQHEYLGIPVGTGDAVFENLELRTITDAEAAAFDRIWQGVDWGWMPDPFAFVRLHYDAARETVYLLDELYGTRITNEESARELRRRGYGDAPITCDSAEPKSVADYRALGLPARAAVKGPGSVAYGMKWLQRRRIVIDRARTPRAAEEFAAYAYERGPDGILLSGYSDRNNHLIDAVRYALERVMNRRGTLA